MLLNFDYLLITTLFDLKTKKTKGIKGEASYSFDYINSTINDENVKKELRVFNSSACATDNYFVVLKNGNLYNDILNKDNDRGMSVIHIYDWEGNLKKIYALDKDVYEIAYHDTTNTLYCLSRTHKLYKYQLPK